MAELNARIIAKASATAGEEPAAGDLEVAELAVNTADGKIFTKHTDGSIVEITGSGGGGGGAVSSVNGQTGTVILNVEDLNDVDTASSYVNYTFFDSGQSTFSDPLPSVTQGTVDASLGDNAYKVSSTVAYGDGSGLSQFLENDGRYDVVNMRIRSTNAIDTNNRVSIGGNKQELGGGGGWTIYTRDTGYGFYADAAFTEIGTRSAMDADTWYKITYVLDWGSVQRTSLPVISLWLNGSIEISQETLSVAYSELTGPEGNNFRLANSSFGQNNQGDKFWDDIRVVSGDAIPWGMTDSTITDPAGLMDAFYVADGAEDGQALLWNDARGAWQPGTIGLAVDYDQDPVYGRFNWTWDADKSNSTYPGDGVAWPGTYPVNYIWFTTIDNGGIDCQSELYALTGSDNLKLYRNNSLIYEGAAAFFANKSSGRITLSFGVDVDHSTFSSGDIIGLESDSWVGDAKTLGTGQILQYDATPQAWTPIVPDFVRAVNGQKVNATIGVTDLSGLESGVPERPSYVWIYNNINTANPSTGRVTDYTPYGTSSFFINTTDDNGVDLQTELYNSFNGMRIKIWVNGELFYDGISSRTLATSNDRVDFEMVGADITSWVDGDVIGFWTELLPNPASSPDKSIVYYAEGQSSWIYGKSPLGIQDASDYQKREDSGQITLKRVTEEDLEDTGVKGGWSIFGTGNQFYYSQFDTDITDNLSNGDSITMEVPGMASPFATTLTTDPQQAGTSRKYFFNISPSAPAEIINTPNGTNLIIKSVNLTSNPSLPLNGDVLQWVEADEKFVPTQLPDAAATRTLLGIGEYVDDAAAGTGGVASGAMYYNTTSSDYRLKT